MKWWILDAIFLFIVFSISPLLGFVCLVLNVVFILVQLANRHETVKIAIADAQIKNSEEYRKAEPDRILTNKIRQSADDLEQENQEEMDKRYNEWLFKKR